MPSSPRTDRRALERATRKRRSPDWLLTVVLFALLVGFLAGTGYQCGLVNEAEAEAAEPNLATAIHLHPSSAHPSLGQAGALAQLFQAYCADPGPWLVAALSHLESGWRPAAVRPVEAPVFFGLLQAHRGFWPRDEGDPLDPATALRVGCAKLRTWRGIHERNCAGDGHPWLAHHFGGNVPSDRARRAALFVYRKREALRRAGEPG